MTPSAVRDRQPAARGHRIDRVHNPADQARQAEVGLGDRNPARLGCDGHAYGELAEGVLRLADPGLLRPAGPLPGGSLGQSRGVGAASCPPWLVGFAPGRRRWRPRLLAACSACSAAVSPTLPAVAGQGGRSWSCQRRGSCPSSRSGQCRPAPSEGVRDTISGPAWQPATVVANRARCQYSSRGRGAAWFIRGGARRDLGTRRSPPSRHHHPCPLLLKRRRRLSPAAQPRWFWRSVSGPSRKLVA